MTGLLERTTNEIQSPNERTRRLAAERQGRLTKPPGSLGRLETIAEDLAGIMATPEPRPEPCALVLAAADHGVTAEGVSAYPKAVTAQMVHNFLAGGAAINAIAASVGVEIFLVDAGVDDDGLDDPRLYSRKIARGTQNLARGPAMDGGQATAIVEAGVAFSDMLHQRGYRSIALGDMGIGNTTSAAAVTVVMMATDVEQVTGRGTMVDDQQYRRKVEVVRTALAHHDVDPADGLAVLSAVGGYESGFLAGCILGAASRRMPIMLDGFPTTSAALIANGICGEARRYCIAGHRSQEPGHGVALDGLGLKPLLELDMRLGEGTGAVLAFSVVRAACRCLTDMATFNEAAVQDRNE